MLGEEHGEEAVRGNQPDKAAGSIYHCQARLGMLHCTPCSHLLINTRCHHRRVGVHHHTCEGIEWCGQHVLKAQDAVKLPSVTHHNMGGTLISLPH
jgi:hypothetical protein